MTMTATDRAQIARHLDAINGVLTPLGMEPLVLAGESALKNSTFQVWISLPQDPQLYPHGSLETHFDVFYGDNLCDDFQGTTDIQVGTFLFGHKRTLEKAAQALSNETLQHIIASRTEEQDVG